MLLLTDLTSKFMLTIHICWNLENWVHQASRVNTNIDNGYANSDDVSNDNGNANYNNNNNWITIMVMIMVTIVILIMIMLILMPSPSTHHTNTISCVCWVADNHMTKSHFVVKYQDN